MGLRSLGRGSDLSKEVGQIWYQWYKTVRVEGARSLSGDLPSQEILKFTLILVLPGELGGHTVPHF